MPISSLAVQKVIAEPADKLVHFLLMFSPEPTASSVSLRFSFGNGFSNI